MVLVSKSGEKLKNEKAQRRKQNRKQLKYFRIPQKHIFRSSWFNGSFATFPFSLMYIRPGYSLTLFNNLLLTVNHTAENNDIKNTTHLKVEWVGDGSASIAFILSSFSFIAEQ